MATPPSESSSESEEEVEVKGAPLSPSSSSIGDFNSFVVLFSSSFFFLPSGSVLLSSVASRRRLRWRADIARGERK